MKYKKIPLKVKPYVRKYIDARYPGHIRLSSTDIIGYIILSLLEKPNNFYRENKNVLHDRHLSFTDTITVLLPKDNIMLYESGTFELPHTAILINNFLHQVIMGIMYSYCQVYSTVGRTQRQAIEDFCKKYNIELGLDITYDAMRQAEFRQRKSLNKNITEMLRA